MRGVYTIFYFDSDAKEKIMIIVLLKDDADKIRTRLDLIKVRGGQVSRIDIEPEFEVIE